MGSPRSGDHPRADIVELNHRLLVYGHHTNLDEGHSLRLEDAYAIADGEIAIEVGGSFTLQGRGSNQGVFSAEIVYGAYPNLQLSLGTTLATDPRDIDNRPKSGDLQTKCAL
jgi:hypothetical protein